MMGHRLLILFFNSILVFTIRCSIIQLINLVHIINCFGEEPGLQIYVFAKLFLYSQKL